MSVSSEEVELENLQRVRLFARTVLCAEESFGNYQHSKLFQAYKRETVYEEPTSEPMATWMPESAVSIAICGGTQNTIAFLDTQVVYQQSQFVNIPPLKEGTCLFATCTIDDHSGNFKVLVHDFIDFGETCAAPASLERYKQLIAFFDSSAQLKDHEVLKLQWCGFFSYAKKSFLQDELPVGHSVKGLLCLHDEPGKVFVYVNKSETEYIIAVAARLQILTNAPLLNDHPINMRRPWQGTNVQGYRGRSSHYGGSCTV
jgi:hypothetical protein